MKVLSGGVTAAKGFEAASVKRRLNIRIERIWHWFTARFLAWWQELLQPML